jgi:aminoglycoside phosphotransferase family enzyme
MSESEVNSLAKSGRYGDHAFKGLIEETHISWVILTNKYAFKIKKPLKLSFLDFSTLRKRKTFCYKELQLNRRFSPIYLNVSPVYRHNNSWTIGRGTGKILEYVVVMKRLNLIKRMDKLLHERKVSRNQILSLARQIASFHAETTVTRVSFNLAKARAAFNDIRTIFTLTEKYLGSQYTPIIKKSIDWSNRSLQAHATRIRDRIDQGFYRDVHGDLHSGNIFLYKKPIIFDCIEFNDSYRRIDVINEVAFFCMDLDAYKQKSLADIFLKEYQRRSGCFQLPEDEQLFTYYKCYRANVRAKVHALSAAECGDAKSLRRHVAALRTYLQLIKKYINTNKS